MDNPLITGKPRAGKVTTDMLHELADSLNRERFVRGMGRHYRVGREPDGEGGVRHFLTWDTVVAA